MTLFSFRRCVGRSHGHQIENKIDQEQFHTPLCKRSVAEN